jgi:hypothetical protein
MKNIPIVILNRDRLEPLKKLVDILHKKEYYNIIIIDNLSTYPPLLEWYKEKNLNVFVNNGIVVNDNSTLYRLAEEAKIPYFIDIVKDWYIYTDSDVVPIDDVPDNFIEDMIEVCKKYDKHKVALGLKIDDLPLSNSLTHQIVECEQEYWTKEINDGKYKLYYAPVDTTFAVYKPGSAALWSSDSIRMGGNYIATHEPWYYDMDNLPEDELYYTKHLSRTAGPVWSLKIKNHLAI